MTDKPTANIIPMINDGDAPQWGDSYVNLLAGLGVQGRDKFTAQQYAFNRMSILDLENAYRGDWIAHKAVTIPAWDMTREWRSWQADPDQIELLEALEKKLSVQQKVQQAIIKSRLYGGACIVIGVDAGDPSEELDLEMVTQDSLQFLHVVSRHQINAGPIIYDISSKYYGQPEYYEARNIPAGKDFKQAEQTNPAFAKVNVRLHPSRVVKLIGVDTADQLLSDIWGDSVLQSVNDAVKMCGLVTGSLATLIAELKVDIIKIPELKSILATKAGEAKMLQRFSAANAMKSVVNTILIDGNEEWQRINASLAGAPEILVAYMQIASGAVDIPATRFLGAAPGGLNATGESDTRNYYDRLASEQTVTLEPAMTSLDEVLIRSALGERPPEVWYEWKSLWQLSDSEKADIALKKAQAYTIEVAAAQIPPVALANARVNQLIEDGTYPGLEKALEDAALEGDTIEEHNAPAPAPEMSPEMMAMQAAAPPGQPGGPPVPVVPGGNVVPMRPPRPAPPAGGNVFPFQRKRDALAAAIADAFADFDDNNPNHDEDGERVAFVSDFNEVHGEHGRFSSSPGGGGSKGAETPSLKQRANDFIKSGKAKDAIKDAAKAHGAKALATALTGALYHVAGADFPADVEAAIHHEVEHLADNLKVAKNVAHKMMKDAVGKLKKLRGVKDAAAKAGDAELDAMLSKLSRVLDKLEPRYAATHDENECHNESGESGGQFCAEGGSGGGTSEGGKETGAKGNPKSAKTHGERAAKEPNKDPAKAKNPDAAEKEKAAAEKAAAKEGKAKERETAKGEKAAARETAKGERAKAKGEKAAAHETAKGEKAAAKEAKGKEREAAKGEKAPQRERAKQAKESAKGEKASSKERAKSEKAAQKASEKSAKQGAKAGKQQEKSSSKSGGGGGGGGGEKSGGGKSGGKGGGKGGGKSAPKPKAGKAAKQSKPSKAELKAKLAASKPASMTPAEWEAEKARLRKELLK